MTKLQQQLPILTITETQNLIIHLVIHNPVLARNLKARNTKAKEITAHNQLKHSLQIFRKPLDRIQIETILNQQLIKTGIIRLQQTMKTGTIHLLQILRERVNLQTIIPTTVRLLVVQTIRLHLIQEATTQDLAETILVQESNKGDKWCYL